MLQPEDFINAPGRGVITDFIATVKAHGAQGPYQAYAYRLKQVADVVGIDWMIPAWQAVWETNWFTSIYWTRDGNAAGMGIDASGWPTPFAIDPNAGADAADIHLATLWAMTHLGPVPYPAILQPARDALAPDWLSRVELLTTDPARPTVARLQDLNLRFQSTITGDMEATWAWDENYVKGICDRANASGMTIPNQSLVRAYTAYPKLAQVPAKRGAVLRSLPSVDGDFIQMLNAGQRFWVKGFAHASDVNGNDVWVQSAGAHGYWVHSSGVDGIIPGA